MWEKQWGTLHCSVSYSATSMHLFLWYILSEPGNYNQTIFKYWSITFKKTNLKLTFNCMSKFSQLYKQFHFNLSQWSSPIIVYHGFPILELLILTSHPAICFLVVFFFPPSYLKPIGKSFFSRKGHRHFLAHPSIIKNIFFCGLYASNKGELSNIH